MVNNYECQRCGGRLIPNPDGVTAECDSCGCLVTIPKITAPLFNQANQLRLQNEFDRAEPLFRSIIAETPDDPEAYWNLVLCRYGIEYVKDPETDEQKPTCHRMQMTSILDDDDYKKALLYADGFSRRLYQHCAQEIDITLKAAIKKSSEQKPYDIFICFKDRDDATNLRTEDSVIGESIYNLLTEHGYSVFFSRITLKGLLGVEYEPLIFSALQSARVMLAIGTRKEYMEAVWVKNEWGRFIPLMESDKRERSLFVVHQNMTAEDIPAKLRLMPRVNVKEPGYEQELLNGIQKIIGNRVSTKIMDDFHRDLLSKGQQYLDKQDWARAKISYEQILDIDPKNGWGWWGLALAESHNLDGYEIPSKAQEYIQNAMASEDSSLVEVVRTQMQWFSSKVSAHEREIQEKNVARERAEQRQDFDNTWSDLNIATRYGKFYHPDAEAYLSRIHSLLKSGTDEQKEKVQHFEDDYNLALKAKKEFDQDKSNMQAYLQKFCKKDVTNENKLQQLNTLHQRAVTSKEASLTYKWRGSVLVAIVLVAWAVALLIITVPHGKLTGYNSSSGKYDRDTLITAQILCSGIFGAITGVFLCIHWKIKNRSFDMNPILGAAFLGWIGVGILKAIEVCVMLYKVFPTPKDFFDYAYIRNRVLLCLSILFLIFSMISYVKFVHRKNARKASNKRYFKLLSSTTLLQDSLDSLKAQYKDHLASDILNMEPQDAYPEYFSV